MATTRLDKEKPLLLTNSYKNPVPATVGQPNVSVCNVYVLYYKIKKLKKLIWRERVNPL